MTEAEIAGYMGWRGPGAYTDHLMKRIKVLIEEVERRERKNTSEELIRLRGEAGVLIGLLQAALQVIETIDGEDVEECNQLMELQNKIVYAIRARSQS